MSNVKSDVASVSVAKRAKGNSEKFVKMTNHGTVENFQAFDVHTLYRMGAFNEELRELVSVSFTWPGLVRLTANKWRVDVEFRCGARQRIPLVWTPCRFGSFRPWYKCPGCDRRVGKLYNSGASLNCRRCLDLWYSSQRRGAKSRMYLQALKLRLRLNGEASLTAPIPQRPRRCTNGLTNACDGDWKTWSGNSGPSRDLHRAKRTTRP